VSIHYSKRKIKKLFKQKLLKRLEFMESERKKLKFYSIMSTLCVVFLISIFITMQRNPQDFLSIIQSYSYIPPRFMVPTIVGQVIFLIHFFYKRSVFRKRFKKRVIAPVIETFIPDAKYFADKGLSEGDYQRSEFIKSAHNRFHSEDLVTFKYHGLNVKFSEVLTQYVTRGKNKTKRTVFRGFLLKSQLPLELQHKTIIVPDIGESYFGRFLGGFFQKRNIFRKEKIVSLESSGFEKEFAVYSSDQIEARKILTPRLMEKILKYNQKTKKKLYLSFNPKFLYLAVATGHNYFEPKIWKQMNFSDVIKMMTMLTIITEILDVLELEEAISKGE